MSDDTTAPCGSSCASCPSRDGCPTPARDARKARTWAEVDLGIIHRNAAALLRRLGEAGDDLVAVVKADAYGHGAESVAAECLRAGVRRFAVASLGEALALRRAGLMADVFLLSPFLPEEAEDVVRADLIPMVSSREQAEALLAASRGAPLPARCVLKVDTGMGRSGASTGEAQVLWQFLADANDLRAVGLATHFSSADEFDDDAEAATAAQTDAFYACAAALLADADPNRDDGRGNAGVWLSLENSPAALRDCRGARQQGPPPPAVRGHLVRAGLLLYGIEPFAGAFSGLPGLAPALAWKARVTLVRDLPAGSTVGYGRTHTLARPSRVATVAAGYADGLSRRLSNAGTVLVRGVRCPIVGRVSMDQCQIDVTDVAAPVAAGETVTLIGEDGELRQTVPEMAERIDTTPHEPTCALSRRVPRIYVRS